MSRHRNVRKLNYSEEEYSCDDIYGRSLDDEVAISPDTAAEFIYRRELRENPSLDSYIDTRDNIHQSDQGIDRTRTSQLKSPLASNSCSATNPNPGDIGPPPGFLPLLRHTQKSQASTSSQGSVNTDYMSPSLSQLANASVDTGNSVYIPPSLSQLANISTGTGNIVYKPPSLSNTSVGTGGSVYIPPSLSQLANTSTGGTGGSVYVPPSLINTSVGTGSSVYVPPSLANTSVGTESNTMNVNASISKPNPKPNVPHFSETSTNTGVSLLDLTLDSHKFDVKPPSSNESSKVKSRSYKSTSQEMERKELHIHSPSLSDLIQLSNLQCAKLSHSTKVTHQQSRMNEPCLKQTEKTVTSSFSVSKSQRKNDERNTKTSNSPDTPDTLSLSELVKLHSEKHVTNSLSSLFTAMTLPTNKSHSATPVMNKKEKLHVPALSFHQSQSRSKFYSVVMSRSFDPCSSEPLHTIHKLIEERTSQKYHARYMLYFDFLSPSPDDVVKKHQKKGFK